MHIHILNTYPSKADTVSEVKSELFSWGNFWLPLDLLVQDSTSRSHTLLWIIFASIDWTEVKTAQH